MSRLYTVIIETRAQKEYPRLSPEHVGSVRKPIDGLEKEPRPRGTKK
jgi:mRNA-degrading endonuclease RelE of RelBE toxin-antitoxin system